MPDRAKIKDGPSLPPSSSKSLDSVGHSQHRSHSYTLLEVCRNGRAVTQVATSAVWLTCYHDDWGCSRCPMASQGTVCLVHIRVEIGLSQMRLSLVCNLQMILLTCDLEGPKTSSWNAGHYACVSLLLLWIGAVLLHCLGQSSRASLCCPLLQPRPQEILLC